MDLLGNAGLLLRDRQDEKTLFLQSGTGVISSCSIDETGLTIGRKVSTNDGRPIIGLCRSSASCASPSRHAVSSHNAVWASLRKRLMGLRLLNLRVPRPPWGYHIAPWKPQKEAALALWFEVAAQLHRGTRSQGSGLGPPPRRTGLRRAMSGVLIKMTCPKGTAKSSRRHRQ
jgi:hypothetical protein